MRTSWLVALLLAASFASAQTYTNPGEVRVDDPQGAIMQMSDADRTVAAPVGTAHLRYYQGWNLSNPGNKYPSDPKVFTP